MKFLRFVIHSMLALSLATLISSYATLQLVSTGTGMSDLLQKSGVYEMVASQARQSLGSSPKVPAKYLSLFNTSLEKAIDSRQIEAMFKPGIVDISTWLNQPGDTPPPDVIIVIKTAKDALIQELSDGGLTSAELTILQLQLSQQIPDQVRLSSLGDLIGQSSSDSMNSTATPQDTAKQPDSDSVIQSLKTLKASVDAARLALWISIAGVILFTILGIFMSRKLGRPALRGVSRSYIIEGGFWIVLAIVVPIVFKAATTPITQDTILMHVAPVVVGRILAAAYVPAGVILTLGAIGLGVSYLKRSKSLPVVQPLGTPPRR